MRAHDFRLGLVAGVGALLVLLLVGPAGAATELIRIEVDQVVRGDEGEVVPVAAREFPPEVVGQTCDLSVSTVNQRSVHPDNDLLIVLRSRTLEISDFEDASGAVHEFRSLEILGDRVELFVRLGPHGVSSGGYVVAFECALEPPPSSSTSSTTSSTTSTTTSTSSTSTTTTSTSSTTTTTAPSTSTPPTVVPSSSVPVASTVPPTVLGEVEENPALPPQLAFTGGVRTGVVLAGLGLVGAGAILLLAGSRVRSARVD